MLLNSANYFSKEANQQYMSVSQYKSWVGTYKEEGCEERTLAEINEKWVRDKTTALLVGSYVDAYFEGSLDKFKLENPSIFRKDGNLKAEYIKAEEIIKRIERDELFKRYMSGQKQVIMTANMFGADWKIKIDSYLEGKAIVDLKVMESLRKRFWHKEINGYTSFIEEYGYDIQGAIYQEVVYRNTGQRLPFFIAGVSKEKEPDMEIIWIPNDILQERLREVEENMPSILAVKSGKSEPQRCECCDYCRSTKVLKKAIHFTELFGEIE